MRRTNKTCCTKDMASAFEHIRTLHSIVCALMIDVSALRQTLLINQSLVRRYRKQLGINMEESRPLVDAALEDYDETIRRIQNSGEIVH